MLSSKKDFVDALKGLIQPLKNFYTKGCSGINIGSFAASYPDQTAKMEAFARVLWGLAPLWAGGEDAEDFDEIYLKGIINGTDPDSDEYWGDLPDGQPDQRMVEMAALGLGLLIAPSKIWDPLTDKQKENFHKWLMQVNGKCNFTNNWSFFPVLVNLGLKNVGVSYDAERIKLSVDEYNSYYVSSGWYHDGLLERADYYIAFAIHFYALIYATFMEKEDPENSRIFKERAEQFAKSFIYWFSEDGSSVAFGRSLTYRFAQCAFWSACIFAGIRPFEMGVMKGIITRNLEWWLSKPIFDNAGVLSVGYAYPNINMAEQYNAYGSPYWALKSFLILALDEDHEFFKAKPLPLPKLSSSIAIPEAYMTVQRINGYSAILTGGQWAKWNLSHRAEKYSKFAYSSKYAFCVSRSNNDLSNAAPDSTLAFDINGFIFYRRECVAYRVEEDGRVYSRWSPFAGINVETLLIPTENGHIRRHTVTTDFDVTAYDTAFATPHGAGGEISGNGEPVVISCAPNTNLIYPKTEIKAVKYAFKKGTTTVETKVVYPL